MKKIFIVGLVFSLLLSSCGGTTGGVSDSSSEDPGFLEWQETNNFGLSKITTQRKEKVLTDTVSLEEAYEHNVLTFLYRRDMDYHMNFRQLDEYLPIQCVRQMDDQTCYVLYHVEDGGYLYVFFRLDGSPWAYSHWAYMEEALRKHHFSGLKPGDTIEDVYRIDPAMEKLSKLDKHIFAATSVGVKAGYEPNAYYTFHILRNGLLVISYDTSYVIQKIDFHKDYVFTERRSYMPHGTLEEYNEHYNFSILRKDFA